VIDPATEEQGAKFLDRDFSQSFQQLRHYDGQIIEIVKFALTAYAAIGGGAITLYRYGIEKGVDFRAPAFVLALIGALIGVTLLALVVQDRTYFVLTARYLNEHRQHFLTARPLGFKNAVKMYTNERQPPYFNWRSSQTLVISVLALLNSGLAGAAGYLAADSLDSKWWIAVGLSAASYVVQLGLSVRHLRSREDTMDAPGIASAPQEPKAREPDQDTVRFLCDLAVKRHDLAERSFDALNTRLGALFAFNSFLVPASVAALAPRGDGTKVLHGWQLWLAVAVWGAALVTIMIATFKGFRARAIKSLPDPLKLFVNCGSDKPSRAGVEVIRNLDGAWEVITSSAATKSTCLNVAIGAVAVEVILLIVLSVVRAVG
jgi:hypothetical protein